MGYEKMQITSCIANVSPAFDGYLFFIPSGLRFPAEEVLNTFEELRSFARNIGRSNNLVYPEHEAVQELAKTYDVDLLRDTPILIVTNVHPEYFLVSGDGNSSRPTSESVHIVKIPLRKIQADNVRVLLMDIATALNSNDFSAVRWEARKQAIGEICRKYHISDIISYIIPSR